MGCTQHLSARCAIRNSADVPAPYSRPANWWKNQERPSWKETVTSLSYRRAPSYQFLKTHKAWSFSRLYSDKESTLSKKKFQYYLSKWKEEIRGDSSLTNITGNMNYLRIISIGHSAIPLILKELQREPGPWFVALRAISEVDSVGRDSPGDFRKKSVAWIKWGKDNGYI
jgi:hypothetical protein